jgi:type I restriction enzyme S subunit
MAGESVKNYILLKRGEFAYNKGNSKTYQFGCVFDLESFDTGLVPHVYVCFKLNTGLNHRYFKYLFEADYLKPQLGALVNTGVRNNGLLNIKPTEFMNTKVPVPSFGEQERIADVLHTSAENLKILNAKLAHFKQEKKALMQQLLTGKRRVKVDEMEVV